ncbi:hypothetical protein CCP3SC1AL1_320024 [Gammaproteobacteria bacterium]
MQNIAIRDFFNLNRKTTALTTNSGGQKALHFDPMDFSSLFNYREPYQNVRMNFDLLKKVAKDSVVASVIITRVNQISSFSMPARLLELSSSNSLGFRVIHRTKHPKKWSKQDVSHAAEIEKFIYNCGSTERVDRKNNIKRDNFNGFLRKIGRDSLTYDQGVFEKVFGRGNKLLEIWPVDGATIRLAAKNNKEVAFTQVIGGNPYVNFSFDEIGFFIRNPRTDIYSKGYGFSELEQLVKTITSHLNAESYNQKAFTQGTTIQGILNIKGDVDPETMKEFRMQFKRLTSGSRGAHTTPVLQASGGAELLNNKVTNKEMEFNKWIEYLIKITCAIYQIDPAEINFDFRGGGNDTAPLFETNPEAKLKHSKDKGLRPLLANFAYMMNDEVVGLLDSEWMFEFTGIDIRTESELIDHRNKELSSYKKLDEVREEAGLDPVGEEEGGEMILNPQLAGFYQSKSQGGGDQQGVDSELDFGSEEGSRGSEQDSLWQ